MNKIIRKTHAPHPITGATAITIRDHLNGKRIGYVTASGHHTVHIPKSEIPWLIEQLSK